MRLPLLLLVAAVLVAGAAIADHAWKNRRSNHAQLLEWYCMHDGLRCGGPSSVAIEEHWEHREVAYEVAVATLVTAAAAVGVHRFVRRGRRP